MAGSEFASVDLRLLHSAHPRYTAYCGKTCSPGCLLLQLSSAAPLQYSCSETVSHAHLLEIAGVLEARLHQRSASDYLPAAAAQCPAILRYRSCSRGCVEPLPATCCGQQNGERCPPAVRKRKKKKKNSASAGLPRRSRAELTIENAYECPAQSFAALTTVEIARE